jgi:aminoglycoside 3-N-acetyltransferase I
MSRGSLTDCRILTLGSADALVMYGMLRLFGEEFDEASVYQGAVPSERYLRDLLASDSFFAVAALQDDRVVGGLAGYALKKFEQKRTELYIYDLAVAQAFRRRGIATALIEALRCNAATGGAYVIFVQAEVGDDPAIALYDSLGKRESVLHFDIDVEHRTR